MNYDDIIDLPHHVSKRHKPMSLLNRAAQFAPFAALTGHEDAIEETARYTDSEIEIVNDRMAQLDMKLNQLRHALDNGEKPDVTITHFVRDTHKKGGSYQTITAAIKSIDETRRCMVLCNGALIAINDIVDWAVQ